MSEQTDPRPGIAGADATPDAVPPGPPPPGDDTSTTAGATPDVVEVPDAVLGVVEVLDEQGNPLLVDVPPDLAATERPPLVDEHGRVRLSFSRIDQHRRCPRRFRYQYVDRIPGRPAPPLSFGTAIHEALERFYDRKLPVEPTEDELVGFLYETWDSSGFADVDRDEQKRWYHQGQQVLRRYHQRVAGRYRLPVATEAWFELPVDNAVVVGSIDRVDADDDGGLRVVDYKTNKRVRDRTAVARSLQLAIYALACEHLYGELPVEVSLDFVVAGIEVAVGIDEIDLDAAREAVRTTADAVLAASFPPTPSRLCDWCDFKAICPAWEPTGDGQDDEVLGSVEVELATVRRRVGRDLERLRSLEAARERLRDELAERDAADEEAREALLAAGGVLPEQ